MKYLLLSLFSAVLLALSWPTYGVPFFIFFAFVPLLLMEHDIAKFSKIKRKSAAVFLYSYLAFILWNAVTTGWLYNSKNPDGSHSLFAVVLPVMLNSLLMSLAFQCYHWYKNRRGTYFGLAFFVAVWMCFEKVHLSWEFTWPWLNLGNAFADYPRLVQWYDTFGATGGSFWILLINVMAFYTLRIWQAGRVRPVLMKNIAVLAALVLLPMAISIFKYENFSLKPIGKVNVALLQPDLDPYNEKYTRDSTRILEDLLKTADEGAGGKVDYFIGPETSLPGNGSIAENHIENSPLLVRIKGYLQQHPGAVFVTGASTHRFFNSQEAPSTTAYPVAPGTFAESYNTAVQIAPGQPTQLYHKGKLVPAVEIFPYMRYLRPILGNAMLNLGGSVVSLSSDKERKVFTNPYNKGKLAPVICYESIYGAFVGGYVKKGANFLAIMTNDSWWGVSQGHKQLLAYARLRAIETRREVARAANSGISAHINARGDIMEDTIYGDRTALPAIINLYDNITFYTRTGDLLSEFSVFVLGFLLMYHYAQKLASRKTTG